MFIPVDFLRKNEAEDRLSPTEITVRRAEIKSKSAVELDGAERFNQRVAMLSTVAPESLEDAFERYIGDNDLLPINYLQIGWAKSRAVGRLRYFDLRVSRDAMATGFLISPDLVLTNHHVFSDRDTFKNPLIDFDYAYDVSGREMKKVTFQLDPGKFFYTNKNLDCTLIGIAGTDESNTVRASERGCLVLNPGVGKAGNGDAATIIQYPDGNYQQIALRKNLILEIKPTALIYNSDTSPGSSGSPVFNDEWQVIALHSAGVAKKDAAGHYIDKDGKVIPEVSGHIDSSQVVWVSNTGIRVSSLIADWLGQPMLKSSPYLQFLSDPDYTDAKPQTVAGSSPYEASSFEPTPTQDQDPNVMNPIEINPGMNRAGFSININVNFGGTRAAAPAVLAPVPAAIPLPASARPVAALLDAESFESKIEVEQGMDFSDCKGFDDHFMSTPTPLPALGAQLARKAAPLSANSRVFVLNYDHYSAIVHSIRRMPIVSAINVEGDPAVRKDKTDRKDNWFRDNRIDLSVQLTDNFYESSGFDKGHMSRREDADWGASAAAAKSAADLTCMYTNACPQVPDLNRAVFGFHGLWGQLEKIVLEKGARSETGDVSKICVYNGPIFVDTDPTFKGVQIPMRFFKIIVWRNGAGEAKATAFVLSQEDLVGGIQFEELQFDKEFIEHQCSIAFIENLTEMTFTGINQLDTSPRKGDKTAVAVVDKAAVENHIVKHAKTGKKKPAAKAKKKPAVKTARKRAKTKKR